MSSDHRPLVSVVLPVFDGERTLHDAVRSVLEQTWAPVELIVVDDGSRDGSLALARSFAGPAVRVIPSRNGGVGRARNIGIAAARGDLVAFLDHDDALTPRSLEVRVPALLEAPSRFVYGALSWWGPSPDGGETSPPPGHRPAADYVEAWARLGITTPGQVLVRRADLVVAGGFPEDRAHGGSDDRGMWLRLVARGVLPHAVPDVVLRYRVHAGQASRTVGFKRARLALREATVEGGDPPRRLVPEDVAAPVLADLAMDLALDLLDHDPREAAQVAARARARHPAVVDGRLWREYRAKRRRKTLARVPLIGPLARALARRARRPAAGPRP
ncbi:MAG: glycosyltransferase family 2 protein [Planctomycetes bacterium]|nr:glycosyltransferase family 2 protein [Planctomycetota bacterium]